MACSVTGRCCRMLYMCLSNKLLVGAMFNSALGGAAAVDTCATTCVRCKDCMAMAVSLKLHACAGERLREQWPSPEEDSRGRSPGRSPAGVSSKEA